MKKRYIVLVALLIIVCSVELASAVWYNPFTWFTGGESSIQNSLSIQNNSEWKILKQTGNEENFDVYFTNLKDKKTDICFVLKDGVNPLDVDLTTKTLYDIEGNPILDDKSKTITLKYESSKCNVFGIMKDGYHLSLTNAQAVNINDYIKLGEHSIILGYEDYEQVVYEGKYFNITASLRNETNYLSGAVTDGLKFSYGSTEWQNMTYVIHSSIPVVKYRNRWAFQNGDELIFVDTFDICNQFNPETNLSSNCKFNNYMEDNESYLEIYFYGNDTDPTYTITELGDGINEGTTTAYNVTWVNISESTPYDDLFLYYPFDVNSSTVIDYSTEGNDGTSAGGFRWVENSLYGGGGNFTDTNDDYIDPSYTGCFNKSTFLTWIKLSGADTEGEIFYKDSSVRHLFVSSGRLGIYYYGLTTGLTYSDTSAYETGKWMQVGVMYNGTHICHIRDGQVIKATVATGTVTCNANKFYFGRPVSAKNHREFDEVMIFNNSLTEQELLDIYNNQSARFLTQGNYSFYQGIDAGNTSVNVTTTNEQLMDSDINITVCYDDSGWTCNDWQNLADVNTFNITSTATNLSINYTLFSGNSTSNFYSPIIYDDITIETWGTSEEPPEDNVYPIFTENKTSIANNTEYNPTNYYQFNITIMNTNSTAGIDFNGTNYSLSNISSEYFYNFSSLGAGDYSYYYWAYGNGTENNFNASKTYDYTIAKNTSNTATLNVSPSNPVDYGTETNVSCSVLAGTPNLHRDGENITNPDVGILGAGTYEYVCNTTGNANYTDATDSDTLIVNQESGSVELYLNGSREPITMGLNQNITLLGNVTFGTMNSSLINLTIGGEEVNSSETLFSLTYVYNSTNDIGIHPVNFSYDGNENYTGSYEVWNINVSDIIAPIINITYPEDSEIYTNLTLDLNYTIGEELPDSCWYSNDSGVTNSSPVSAGDNFTIVTGSEGENTWFVYCNDTSNNIGQDNVTFNIDTTSPNLTAPENQSIMYLDVFEGVTFTGSDDSGISTYFIDDTDNFTINSTGFLNWTGQLAVGNYTVNVSVNDTVGFINSTLWNLEITKNNGTCQILFNESSPLTYPQTFLVYSDCNSAFVLYRNGTTIENNSEQALGVGAYNFSVFRNDTQNFTDIYNEDEFIISQATPDLSLDFDPSDEEDEGTETTVTGLGCPAQIVCNLHREGENVSNPDVQTLEAGVYVYVFNTTGNTNYTSKSVTGNLTINEVVDNPPTFNNLRNFTHTVNTSFSESITASDDNGIDTYWLNDTTVFDINASSGLITNSTPLVNVTIYYLNISVNDTIGQITSGEFYINITGIPASQCDSTYNYTRMALSNKRPYIQLCQWRDFR